eukprot:Seg172.2 transcript_id=Seg172.2/GoldUCD/mRNA.D3Y31 product="putative serine/threonine-protein kinase PkwA" protein_id=Seg172.2/GoldUCD/D3Y31
MEMNGGDFMFPFRGRLFRRLELGSPGAILSTAASSDDSTIATCSTDTKVLLWDLSSGKRVNCLQGHTAEVTTCCFGDDLLATGSRDGVVILWKYQTGKRVSRISFHQGAVQSTSISQDGQLLGSAGDDGQAIVYRIRSGEGEFISGPENRQIKGHTDAVNDISFSPDSCNFVTCSSDGTIQLWDCETGKNRAKIQTKYGKLISTKFTPNGKRVATLSSNYLSVWDLTTGKVEWEVEDEDGRNYQALAVHPFQDLITLVGMDSSLTHQSLHEHDRNIVKTTDHKGPILSCNFSPSGRLGMTGGIDGKVLVWM